MFLTIYCFLRKNAPNLQIQQEDNGRTFKATWEHAEDRPELSKCSEPAWAPDRDCRKVHPCSILDTWSTQRQMSESWRRTLLLVGKGPRVMALLCWGGGTTWCSRCFLYSATASLPPTEDSNTVHLQGPVLLSSGTLFQAWDLSTGKGNKTALAYPEPPLAGSTEPSNTQLIHT